MWPGTEKVSRKLLLLLVSLVLPQLLLFIWLHSYIGVYPHFNGNCFLLFSITSLSIRGPTRRVRRGHYLLLVSNCLHPLPRWTSSSSPHPPPLFVPQAWHPFSVFSFQILVLSTFIIFFKLLFCFKSQMCLKLCEFKCFQLQVLFDYQTATSIVYAVCSVIIIITIIIIFISSLDHLLILLPPPTSPHTSVPFFSFKSQSLHSNRLPTLT